MRVLTERVVAVVVGLLMVCACDGRSPDTGNVEVKITDDGFAAIGVTLMDRLVDNVYKSEGYGEGGADMDWSYSVGDTKVTFVKAGQSHITASPTKGLRWRGSIGASNYTGTWQFSLTVDGKSLRGEGSYKVEAVDVEFDIAYLPGENTDICEGMKEKAMPVDMGESDYMEEFEQNHEFLKIKTRIGERYQRQICFAAGRLLRKWTDKIVGRKAEIGQEFDYAGLNFKTVFKPKGQVFGEGFVNLKYDGSVFHFGHAKGGFKSPDAPPPAFEHDDTKPVAAVVTLSKQFVDTIWKEALPQQQQFHGSGGSPEVRRLLDDICTKHPDCELPAEFEVFVNASEPATTSFDDDDDSVTVSSNRIEISVKAKFGTGSYSGRKKLINLVRSATKVTVTPTFSPFDSRLTLSFDDAVLDNHMTETRHSGRSMEDDVRVPLEKAVQDLAETLTKGLGLQLLNEFGAKGIPLLPFDYLDARRLELERNYEFPDQSLTPPEPLTCLNLEGPFVGIKDEAIVIEGRFEFVDNPKNNNNNINNKRRKRNAMKDDWQQFVNYRRTA